MLALVHKIPRGFRNKEQADGNDGRDGIDDRQGNYVALPAAHFGGLVVDDVADEGAHTGENVERCNTGAAKAGWNHLLNVELAKGHEISIGDANEEAAGVDTPKISGALHDAVGAAAQNAGYPNTVSAAEFDGHRSSHQGSGEGADGHQGRD